MAVDPVEYIEEVGDIVSGLRELGLEPVLVGGVALLVLGSRRVTQDFDFVIARPRHRLGQTLDLFYHRGFELVSCLNEAGEVVSTIDNRKVASMRLRLDAPDSAFFFHPKTRLRIDLLFDFPIPATKLAEHARRRKILSHVFEIASEEDLLHLKKIAKAARALPEDIQDIAFLEARLKSAK